LTPSAARGAMCLLGQAGFTPSPAGFAHARFA
jgi:hypothetical protein